MGKNGYTLVEIVVAVAISVILLWGTIGLASLATETLSLAKSRSQTHSSLTDALSKLSTVSTLFPYVQSFGSGTLDYAVFTNTGKTSGVLLGVSDVTTETSEYRLSNPSLSQIYAHRVLVAQELTSAQVNALLFEPETAFEVPIYAESIFPGIVVDSLMIEEYNSGSLLDSTLSFYPSPRNEWIGKEKTQIQEFSVSVNIVF